MSPLYDVAPVYLLNPVFQTFGHALDGQGRLPHLTAAHLRRSAVSWGLADDEVRGTIHTVAARLRTALVTCTADGIDSGPVAELVDARAADAMTTVG